MMDTIFAGQIHMDAEITRVINNLQAVGLRIGSLMDLYSVNWVLADTSTFRPTCNQDWWAIFRGMLATEATPNHW